MTLPTFAPVFGGTWDGLPPALRLHYANRPFSRDRVTVKGILTIRMGPVMRVFAPVMGALGMLTPCEGTDIPCTVHFLSEPKSRAFIFERHFDFPGRKPYVFRSRLVQTNGHEVVEYMRCGIGWRCTYDYDGAHVRLRHAGYLWRLFGIDIPLWGVDALAGRGSAHETATGEDTFSMRMALGGGLFGQAASYSYEGAFKVIEVTLDDA